MSHPFVQGSIPYEAQQLVVNQVEVFLPSVDDGDDDIMADGFFRVMGPNFQILCLDNVKVLVEKDRKNVVGESLNDTAEAENSVNGLTRQVSGKVWVVHEAVARKLYTLQPDWNMDVIEPEEDTSEM